MRRFFNKKTMIAVAIILVGGLIAYFGFFSSASMGIDESALASLSAAKNDDIVLVDPNKDTDGDGLFDWQENILGTDTHNKDTDGDGFSDYDETKNGFDPLLKGDGRGSDRIVPVDTIEAPARKSEIKDNVTINTFAGFMNTTPEGLPMLLGNEDGLTQSVLANVYSDSENSVAAQVRMVMQAAQSSAKSVEKTFNPDLPREIAKTPRDTQEERKAYVATLGDIVQTLKESPPAGISEFMLAIAEFFADESDATGLDTIIASHKKAADDLINLAAPESFYEYHMKFTKFTYAQYLLFSDLKNYKEDHFDAVLKLSLLDPMRTMAEKLTEEFLEIASLYHIFE